MPVRKKNFLPKKSGRHETRLTGKRGGRRKRKLSVGGDLKRLQKTQRHKAKGEGKFLLPSLEREKVSHFPLLKGKRGERGVRRVFRGMRGG